MNLKEVGNATHFTNEFLAEASEKNMYNLVFYANENELSDTEILYLAEGLANSGNKLNLKDLSNICDIPSTGGPSSLSTLLCPLFLRFFGNTVLKLGVPGRPAGGIDVLSQISGYKTTPNISEITDWINKIGYVHFLANNSFAPLDSILFKFRKQNNQLNIPSLVIASILSKKIAAGLNYVGLDIRVSKFGNFGTTWEAARQNGRQFNRVANMAGIKAKSFITNGSSPQQPFIGRGESLLALNKIFTENADTHLKKHISQCFSMAYSLNEIKENIVFSARSLKDEFMRNVTVQGGRIDSFTQIIYNTEKNHAHQILAASDGILSIDLEKIRVSIVNIQTQYFDTQFPDPCGIILKAMHNEYIYKNEIICTFRCLEKNKSQFENELKKSFTVLPTIVSCLDFEEII